jgi:uridine kinase
MAQPGPFLVGIAGGSGSGKTALAAALADTLAPFVVGRLAQDSYYRDRRDVPTDARAALNFDVPEALDADLFVAHLRALRGGAAVHPPQYCFVTHRRLGRGAPVGPADLVVVDGLLLFADPRARALLDLRIYLDAPVDLRLSRRLARDVRERARTEEAVLAQCRASTFPAHHRYVEPSRAWADLVLVNAGRLDAVAEIAATIVRTHHERWLALADRARSA